MYCFGCKYYTKNFRPQEVKMINKVLKEKSHCVVCRSKISRSKIKIFKTKNTLTTNVTYLKKTSCKQLIKIR